MYLPVKPVSMINPLPQDFNGWLGTILLLGWHVKIIYKHHHLLADRRSIHTTPSSTRQSVIRNL